MAQPYSARSRAIEPFHVMALLARANQLQADGHDVIHLEIGEPDFTTAAPIVAAGQAALANGHTRYTAARGSSTGSMGSSVHFRGRQVTPWRRAGSRSGGWCGPLMTTRRRTLRGSLADR